MSGETVCRNLVCLPGRGSKSSSAWCASRRRTIHRFGFAGAITAANTIALESVGPLRSEVLQIVPGQKIAYVVDAVYHAENARRIVELVRNADILFMETVFLTQDAERAATRFHLTARQAGTLARAAGVKTPGTAALFATLQRQPGSLRREPSGVCG